MFDSVDSCIRSLRTPGSIGASVIGGLAAVLLVAGCPDDPPAPSPDTGTADTGGDAMSPDDAGPDDSGPDDTGGDDADGGDDGMSMGECETADDCTEAPQHVAPSCTSSGMCEYTECESGWEDFNDDLSDGCECNSDDIATYWADSDGDGYGNDSDTQEACGSAPSGYVEAGANPADCNDENADVNPSVADDENWLCDGLDNDCDGTTDETCCGAAGNSPEPSPVKIGDIPAELSGGSSWPHSEMVEPVLSSTTSNAPSEATSTVAWMSQPTEITVQHLDRTGSSVGSTATVSTDRRVLSLAVTPTPQGYELTYSTYATEGDYDTTESRLYTRGVDADLGSTGSEVLLKEQNRQFNSLDDCEQNDGECVARAFDNLETEYLNNRVMLSLSTQRLVFIFEQASVTGFTWNVNDRGNTINELDWSGNRGGNVANETFPSLTANSNSGFAVAWIDGNDDDPRLYGITYDDSLTATGTFDVQIQDGTGDSGEPIDIVWRNSSEVLVMTPDESSGSSKLVAKVIDPNSGNVVSTKEISDSAFDPVVAGRDTSGDGFADMATLAWREPVANQSDQELVAGDISLGSLDNLERAGRLRLPRSGIEKPSLEPHEKGVSAVWGIDVDGDSDNFAEFAPASFGGVGICQPNP